MVPGAVRSSSGDQEPKDVAWAGPLQGGPMIWRSSPESIGCGQRGTGCFVEVFRLKREIYIKQGVLNFNIVPIDNIK